MADVGFTSTLGSRITLGVFLIGLLILSYQVLHLFLVPVAWGLILVYVTWPLSARLRRLLAPYPSWSAFLMTVLLGLTFALPALWVLAMLRDELPAAYARAVALVSQGPAVLPPSVARLPWIGPELERLLALLADDPASVRAQVLEWLKPMVDESVKLIGNIGETAFKFAFALLSAFFLYRDGERLLDQTRHLLFGLLGERGHAYLRAVGDTTRAVLYGLVLTALLQGVLAGLGYWAAGVEAPILLSIVTAILALVPFGTPLVWGLVSLWLFLTGETWAAAGLAAWGALVVSQIDNLFRPFVISNTARIPYIWVLFAVLGGISAFGLVGLFLGPIVVAVLLAVWREWIAEHVPRAEAAPSSSASGTSSVE